MDYSLLIGIHNIDLSLRDRGDCDGNAVGSTPGDLNEPTTSCSDDKPTLDKQTGVLLYCAMFLHPFPAKHKWARQKSVMTTWETIQGDTPMLDLGDEYPYVLNC
jgi:hypothetical protein